MAIIITDSTSTLIDGQTEFNNLRVAHFDIVVDGESFVDNVTIKTPELISSINAGIIPTTSQPSPGTYLDIFKQYPDEEIVVIAMSSKLSGSHNSAENAKAQDAHPNRIHIIDSWTLGVPLKDMAMKAAQMGLEGASLKEIISTVEYATQNTMSYLAPNDFDFLLRGGRLSPAAARIGKLLKAIAIVRIGEAGGKLERQGIKLSWNGVASSMEKGVAKAAAGKEWLITILHDNQEKAADHLRKLLSRHSNLTVKEGYQEMTPLMVTHGGPHALVCQATVKL